MLALVGSGEYLPAVDPIDQTLLNRLTEPAKVVCLPTAAGREGEAMVQSWMDKGIRHFQRLGVEVTAVPVINHTTAQNENYAATIRQANFVYLSGGHPGHLVESFRDTPVWQAILNVHLQGGIVAGCSAGAMIMGTRVAGPGGNQAGFDLIPNSVVMPHFDEFPGIFTRITRMLSDKSLTMIGIDGKTALVVDNGRYEVLGQNNVTIFKKSGTIKYAQGPLPDDAL